jgi:hypothetical protein
MKKRDKPPVTQYLEQRLIKRLRIYTIISLLMLAVIVFEVLKGTFSIPLVMLGILIGLGIGTIVSRMYHLSWDEETNNVMGRIDWIGAIILGCYLIFIFTRTNFLGYWVQGAPLLAVVLSITAGTMIGRVMGTERGINKILKAWKILG